MYLMTICGNLLILVLIHSDDNLHTPMYFFLGNLACLDTFFSTVTVPQILSNLFSGMSIISLTDCVAQIFFFILFCSSEVYLLAVMSYDRYTAICLPLHYIHIMSWKVCVLLVLVAWTLGFFTGLTHTLGICRLEFCAENTIHGFFCDLPLLFQISCTDIFINILLMFLLTLPVALLALVITLVPYVHIFQAILRIPSKVGKHKAFSTCTSHLTVVFIFYGTFLFTYLRPTPEQRNIGDTWVPLIYTVISPVLNPFIYSLRNNDIKGALMCVLHKSHLSIMKSY
ncbi:olfactory receptor 1468-like [Rhinophrynus dorsalis]